MSDGLATPPRHCVSLDAQFHNTNELTTAIRCFQVTVAGTVKFVAVGDTAAVTITCLAGVQYWYAVRQIFATGTTATGVVGGY